MKSRQEGFALAAAVLAMLVVGAIVTGGFYAASQEHAIAQSSDAGDLALYIAETGLNARLAVTPGPFYEDIAKGDTREQTAEDVTYGGRTVGSYTTRITRLSEKLVLVESTGTVSVGGSGPYAGATRTVGTVARIRTVNFNANTAIQVYGGLNVSGSTTITGRDTAMTTWTGCTLDPNSSAVLANPTSALPTGGAGVIDGDTIRQAMTERDFTEFGDLNFDELAGMANHSYPETNLTLSPAPTYDGTGSTQTCRTSDRANWGHPTSTTSACSEYFPIIEAQHNLTVNGNGYGQGILLVRGNLRITGAFTFYGIVVVKGTVDFMGAGGAQEATVFGSVIAYGGGNPLSNNTALGNSDIRFSSCAIKRAVDGNNKLVRGTPIKDRSWVDVSAVRSSY